MGKKKILLTGASGTIGQQILKSDLRKEYYFQCLFRTDFTDIGGDKNIIVKNWSKASLENILEETDTIIHLASSTKALASGQSHAESFELTKMLVEVANKASVKNFVFFSSDLASQPKGNYGKYKLKSEEVITKNFKHNWLIVRCSPVWVRDQPSSNSTVYKLIDSVKKQRLIILPNGGRFTVTPIWIDDLVDNLRYALDKEEISSMVMELKGDPIEIRELLEKVSDRYSVETRIVNIPLWLLKFCTKSIMLLGCNLTIFETLLNIGEKTDFPRPTNEIKRTKINDILKRV